MPKPGRPSKAATIANALLLRESIQAQIVSRLSNSLPIRKVLVDYGKKVTLPELRYMALAHILDVMNDDRIKPSERFPYIKLVHELSGDIGKSQGEVNHKHTLEFSEGTRELLATRIKQLMDEDRKGVIDVIPEGESYKALPEHIVAKYKQQTKDNREADKQASLDAQEFTRRLNAMAERKKLEKLNGKVAKNDDGTDEETQGAEDAQSQDVPCDDAGTDPRRTPQG